jgi:hypothetical protein
VFGNPAKIFMNLQEVLLNVFKESKDIGGPHNTKKVFKESFLTLFQAHSKATGNYEHVMFTNYMNDLGSRNK